VFEVCDLGKSNLIIGYTWLHKHNLEIDWEMGKAEMMRCPRKCNTTGRRQKGPKKRKQEVGERNDARLWLVMLKKEIDAEMPNVVEPITIKKND